MRQAASTTLNYIVLQSVFFLDLYTTIVLLLFLGTISYLHQAKLCIQNLKSVFEIFLFPQT